jgi:hypothetical protein
VQSKNAVGFGGSRNVAANVSIRTRGVDLFRDASVVASETAIARDIDGGAQCLGDEMAGLTMVRRIPMRCLVFKLVQRRHPAGAAEQSR